MTTVVEVDGLRKVYDGRAVVDGVSFTVQEGEIFGILGPNGAGKTTTVECLSGLRRPDGGRATVLGMDPRRDGARVRRVLGVQLQSSGLQDKIRVGEAIDVFASFHADPWDRDDLVTLLDLGPHLRSRWGSLSGGQQQRVSIALALVGRPRVAILDELTTGLDPQARRDVWRLIERVRDSGVTVLLVTHLMEEAERLCDRLALIDDGRVTASGTPRELVDRASGGVQELRFTPSSPVDLARIGALAGVDHVGRERDEVLVQGADGVVQTVLALLTGDGVDARRLRVESRTLDDAFLALTRRPEDGDGDTEVDRPVRNANDQEVPS